MKKVFLVDPDDAREYNLNDSRLYNYAALEPVSGHFRLIEFDGVFKNYFTENEKSIRSRKGLQALGAECDLYIMIANVPETTAIRTKLSLGRTILNVDDNGLATIESKKYFVLRDSDLVGELKKTLRKLKVNTERKVAISRIEDSEDMVHIRPYSANSLPSKDECTGSLINVSDVLKLKKEGVEVFLETYLENEEGIKRITMEEALDDTIEYEDYDKVTSKTPSKRGDEIITIYEYDPFEERRPIFGEPCELERKVLEDGSIAWKLSAKIVQNENPVEYAMSVAQKGNRVGVILPKTEEGTLMAETLITAGKGSQVKDFVVKKELGKNMIVEVTPMGMEKGLK